MAVLTSRPSTKMTEKKNQPLPLFFHLHIHNKKTKNKKKQTNSQEFHSFSLRKIILASFPTPHHDDDVVVVVEIGRTRLKIGHIQKRVSDLRTTLPVCWSYIVNERRRNNKGEDNDRIEMLMMPLEEFIGEHDQRTHATLPHPSTHPSIDLCHSTLYNNHE
jgi:hypothetical protein